MSKLNKYYVYYLSDRIEVKEEPISGNNNYEIIFATSRAAAAEQATGLDVVLYCEGWI